MNDYNELLAINAEYMDRIAALSRENVALSKECEELTTKCKQLERERDAFMDDFMRGFKKQVEEDHGIYRCDLCIHNRINVCGNGINVYDCELAGCNGFSKWQWRGLEGKHE